MKGLTMNLKHVAGGLLALLALAVVVAWAVWRGRAGGGDDAEPRVERRADGAKAPRRSAAGHPSGPRKRVDRKASRIRRTTVKAPNPEDVEDGDGDMSPADRRLMEAIERGQDDESLEQLVKIIPEVSASTNAEVRSELVDALGSFGEQGMNHLLPFMADPDDDVRGNAIDNWTSALGEVEDEKMRARMIGAVMQVLSDEDALEFMSNELIDIDEEIALQTLVDVIEGGKATPQGVATAREQYEFLTGDEYTTVEAANQWLAENYEPPEPEAAAAGKELKR